MAIKRILRATEIADFPFRSLTDVEKYLDVVKDRMNDEEEILRQLEQQFSRTQVKAAGTFTIQRGPVPTGTKNSPRIDTMHVDKVVVPNLSKLKEHFQVVDEMSEQVDHLNTLHAQMSVQFRNVRGANETLKSVLSLKKSLEQKVQRGLDFLSKVGHAHAPTEFRTMVQQSCDALSGELTYSKSSTAIYAVQHDNDDLTFSEYVKLINLVDDEGDSYPEFYIVFTAVLRPSQLDRAKMGVSYYVNVMSRFQPPKPNNYGRQFSTVPEALKQIGVLFGIENLSISTGTLPHNLGPKDLDKNQLPGGDRVADIKVEHDSITVILLKNVNATEAEKITLGLHTYLQQVLKAKGIRNVVLKHKLSYDSSARRYFAKFTLATPASKNQVDTHTVDFLKERFDLDDDTLRDVINRINIGKR